MRRLLVILIATILSVGDVFAQTTVPQPGDPPVAALIAISEPDAAGFVTITGAAGAVFPNAYVVVRNLYTQATTYARTGVTGSFSTRIYGGGNTPFWISPGSQGVPENERGRLGSLPGGEGVILYGAYPQTAAPLSLPVTRLAIDGSAADWSGYPDSALGAGVSALRNTDSLYVSLTDFPAEYARAEIRFTVDAINYAVSFHPAQSQSATLRRLNPSQRDLGLLTIAARQADALEVRIPFSFSDRSDNVQLDSVSFFDALDAILLEFPLTLTLPRLDENDGIFRPGGSLDATRFTLAGTADGDAIWSAQGQIDALDLNQGDTLSVQLDVQLNLPALPADIGLGALVGLQPIAVARANSSSGAAQAVGDIGTNNGWSAARTPSGLAIDNLTTMVALGDVMAAPYQQIGGEASITFPLDWSLPLPDDIAPGLYVPVIAGYMQSPQGSRAAWNSASAPVEQITRLPVVIRVGGVESARLVWTLFMDDPSDGSRGVLADEDRAFAALSNRTRWNSDAYILPPGTYSLEPSLLNQMTNLYTYTGEPLIPFSFPSGRLAVSVTKPNQTVDDLGEAPILQSRISSTAFDERTRFGTTSPVDIYGVTTRSPALTDYVFDQYGDYEIRLMAEIEDVWGNRYTGGGTYHVTIAEPLDLTPGVLPGTPFEVGDSFNPGMIIAPGVSADIDVRLRVFPLDGGDLIEYRVDGRTNRYGYFQASDQFYTFTTPGEYVVDYEARFRDRTGRLWAASLRGAGVIASPNASLIVHGERGLPDQTGGVRSAWYEVEQYVEVVGGIRPDRVILNFPYFGGDTALIGAEATAGMNAGLTVQDQGGAYASALLAAQPDGESAQGVPYRQLAALDELPVIDLSAPDSASGSTYAYISAVRAGVSVRQFVAGGVDGGLPLGWQSDDPHNLQIGAGSGGERYGDYMFLFGGVISRATPEPTAAIYGAFASVVEDERDSGIIPPGRAPVLTLPDTSYDMFVLPTGIRPGAILVHGDTVALAGQVAPALPADIEVTVTAPDGTIRQFTLIANQIGYFFAPEASFRADQFGVWTVEFTARYAGATSIGVIDPISGGVVGADDGRFAFYVVPPNATQLPWNVNLQDTTIPVAIQYNFNFVLPDDWTNIRVFHTLTLPGHILEDGELRMFGRSFTYTLNPPQLIADFPNVENDPRARGVGASDTKVLTFYVTGTDADGDRQLMIRQFVILHDRLVSFE